MQSRQGKAITHLELQPKHPQQFSELETRRLLVQSVIGLVLSEIAKPHGLELFLLADLAPITITLKPIFSLFAQPAV